MTLHAVPLSPHVIADIESFVADLEPASLQQTVREQLVAKAVKEASEAAVGRVRYRAAYEEATSKGYADPVAFAQARVSAMRLDDLHAERVRAIFKRAAARHTKRVDRVFRDVEKASKSAKPELRRLPQRDRQYVEIIGKAEREGWLGDAPLVLTEITRKLGRYRLPHWEKTSISLKVLAMSVVCAEEGAQTINLRINKRFTEEALRSPRGAVSYMQDRIRRELGKRFGKTKVPDFWVVVETDSKTRFHLHGAVITPNLPDAARMVDDALRAAGGTWDAKGGEHHQQVSRSLDDPLYWACYVCKRINVGAMAVATKLYASTLRLRSLASERWERLRVDLPQSPIRGA